MGKLVDCGPEPSHQDKNNLPTISWIDTMKTKVISLDVGYGMHQDQNVIFCTYPHQCSIMTLLFSRCRIVLSFGHAGSVVANTCRPIVPFNYKWVSLVCHNLGYQVWNNLYCSTKQPTAKLPVNFISNKKTPAKFPGWIKVYFPRHFGLIHCVFLSYISTYH